MTAEHTPRPTALALALGYGGLLPFVALAAASWLAPAPHRVAAGQVLAAYAAAIASFIGALHWGLAMRSVGAVPPGGWIWGVVPSLVAWVALLLSPPVGLWVLSALLVTCFAIDRVRYPALGVAGWLPLRLHLSVVASTCCAAAALGAAR